MASLPFFTIAFSANTRCAVLEVALREPLALLVSLSKKWQDVELAKE